MCLGLKVRRALGNGALRATGAVATVEVDEHLGGCVGLGEIFGEAGGFHSSSDEDDFVERALGERSRKDGVFMCERLCAKLVQESSTSDRDVCARRSEQKQTLQGTDNSIDLLRGTFQKSIRRLAK